MKVIATLKQAKEEAAKHKGWYVAEHKAHEDVIHWALFTKTGKYAKATGIARA